LIDNVVVNTPHPYYRFHGVPLLHRSSYDSPFLENVVNAMGTIKEVKNKYLFFNNTRSGAAIENARQAQQLAR
jgi:uncharacterized protein YecE (DUF72 family)